MDQCLQFLESVCRFARQEVRHQALTAEWNLYLHHRSGWVEEMVDTFIKMKCVRDEEGEIRLKGWKKQPIIQKLDDFKEVAYRCWEQEMWIQLSAENSKYAFLLSVHPSFGMADVCQATWRFGL